MSFFSSSGYEVVIKNSIVNVIFYLPSDSKKNAKELIKLLNPSILILVKYDFWYNILSELFERKITVVLVSSIFRPKQVYFSFFGKWFLNKLKNINHFFVQNKESKDLLNQHGIFNTTISGDTRFDTVKNILKNNNSLTFLDIFCENNKILVLGSSWNKDEALFINYINNCNLENVKFIIAPHEINATKILTLQKSIKKESILYSSINQENINSTKLKEAKLLIVDTIGLLTKIYSYASIAYVGGGLNKTGVHNVLEPAVFGIPVIYGNNYSKYQEAIDLINCGGGFSIKNYLELENYLTLFLTNEIKRNEVGQNTYSLIKSAPKSTKIILENLPVL